MIDVPPEQVPEGILVFARSHRTFIEHVRIVITSNSGEDSPRGGGGGGSSANHHLLQPPSERSALGELSSSPKEHAIYPKSNGPLRSYSMGDVPPSPSASAMESAASILAADELNPQPDLSDSFVRREFLFDNDDSDRPERLYMVLFQLCSEKAANDFVQDLDNKPYTILDETERATVHHVVALRGQDGVSLMSPFFAPETKELGLNNNNSSSNNNNNNNNNSDSNVNRARTASISRTSSEESTEVHNCAVCLERMHLERIDSDKQLRTPLLTTVCNHSFHLDCLLQCKDSPCPVCRYDHSGLNEALSQCHVCGTTQNNYVCLICGVVSCGGASNVAAAAAPAAHGGMAASCIMVPDASRSVVANMSFSHAQQHYQDTLHAYALDTETQHVWDFVGQGYVHRLLQNAKDGKLVEVNDPNSTSHERSLSPGLTDAQEGEVVHRKLEGFASQYYTLLKSQLEQQRIYYEGRLEEIRQEYRKDHRKRSVSASSELIAALKQERNQLAQRRGTLRQRHDKISDDVSFLKNMNESLEANKAQMKRQVLEAQRQRIEAREMIQNCLPPLEEKVTLLMLQLEESLEQESRKPAARR